MKKLFFTLVAALMSAVMSFAQSNLVATLSHNGEISVFHGSSAFKQAMEVAANGDIVTLAGGRYEAAKITKAITIRGAGIEEDATTGAFPTRISGDIQIDVDENATNTLEMEGIDAYNITYYNTLERAHFNKCTISGFSYFNTFAAIKSLTCVNCKITNRALLSDGSFATYVNCTVACPTGSAEFMNCVITGSFSGISNSLFTNCIFGSCFPYSFTPLNSTNVATNCVAWGNVFENINQSTNVILSDDEYNALFKSGTFYELTDEAKSLYVGSDGKEVGIYGGNFPFDVRIPSPQITKCNVAAKTTADGKLSVDIEVKAAD